MSSHADNACAYDENLARQSSVPKSPRTASYGQRARKSSADAFKCTVDLEEQGIADVWPTQNAGDFVAIAAQACQVASGSGLSQLDDHPWTELLASTKGLFCCAEANLGSAASDLDLPLLVLAVNTSLLIGAHMPSAMASICRRQMGTSTRKCDQQLPRATMSSVIGCFALRLVHLPAPCPRALLQPL